MRQIVQQHRIGRHLGPTRWKDGNLEHYCVIEWRYVYDHEGD